jgi:hypothetical protein
LPLRVDASQVYRQNPVVAIEDFGERSLALHCEELRLAELNATARDLVRALNGGATLGQVAEAMAGAYDQPLDRVLSDIQESVAHLVELDIVERLDAE